MLPFLRSDLSQFVAYTPHPGGLSDDAARADAAVERPLIDRVDTNESPYDLPDELKQKLAWQIQHHIESNRYPDGGHGALKQAIAEYVNESASLPPSAITADQISVSSGSDELIRSLLIATCLRGEGAILVSQPTFSMYAILAETLGVPVQRVGRQDRFEMDWMAAQQTLDQTTTPPVRAVFVVHPNSPTGNALTAREFDWLRSLPDHILVVIDEAYFEFSQTTVVAELAERPNWVVLRTFSKAFRLAAHRVGYAIAHPQVAATLEKVRLPYNLPALSQAAASVALAHRSLLLADIPTLLAERDRLTQALQSDARFQVWDSAANFVFTRLNPDDVGSDVAAQSLQLFHTLRQQGTLIRHINGGFRITIGTPDENQRTLQRLFQALG